MKGGTEAFVRRTLETMDHLSSKKFSVIKGNYAEITINVYELLLLS